MNEAETRAELIDPALTAAGWGVVEHSRIRREVIAPGRLIGNGKRAKADIADYVLVYRGEKLAVIEAKKRELPDTEGLAQAKKYAEKLKTRFAYSTNGIGIYQVDMHTGKEGYINQYPTPHELWEATFNKENTWRDRFATIPFEDKSGTWEARYYQHNAIKYVLEAIAKRSVGIAQGKTRILLTMATGTGKTFIAFQLAWKLFQSRWNLSQKPTRRPRILFLADRNILANQAYNSFSAFPDDALVRIDPEEIRKKKRVPKNGSVFFTIFQTFMTKTAGFDFAQQPDFADDDVIEGAIDAEKTYTESDFNRIIEIQERERYRVQLFMAEINQNQKTLVFCANQDREIGDILADLAAVRQARERADKDLDEVLVKLNLGYYPHSAGIF
jgi:type I restriction enzyme R subunit